VAHELDGEREGIVHGWGRIGIAVESERVAAGVL
jgi:hypothetical protein